MTEVGQSQGQQPDVLARLSLPTHPPGGGAAPSSSTYRHVLLSRAISPSMDLVLILSRDVLQTSSSSSQASGNSASSIAGALPAQPSGMSQNMSEARRRMIMLSRQKMLGAQRGAGAAAAATANTPAPRLTRCAPIRISLWRLPSNGDMGALVWDLQVEVPDRWGTDGQDLAELEDLSVTASAWTKRCREITLVVQVSRKDARGSRETKSARYLCIYNVQSGTQERVIPIDESPTSLSGLTWVPTSDLGAACTGSARHILNLLNPLPRHAELPKELRQGPGPPTPLRRRALANKSIKEALEGCSRLADSSPTSSLGSAVLQFPRLGSQPHHYGLVAPPPALTSGEPVFRRRGQAAEQSNMGLLCAWDEDQLFLFFDGTVSLGSVAAGGATAEVSEDGCMRIASRIQQAGRSLSHNSATQEGLSFSTVMPFSKHSRPLQRWKELASTSASLYYLLEHAYDSVMLLRMAHCQLRASSLERWTNSVRAVAKVHATDMHSAIIRTLLTGYANEAMFNLLTGSVSGDDGDMHRLTASSVREIEAEQGAAFRFMTRQALLVCEACERCLVLLRDLKGLLLWPRQSPLRDERATQEVEGLTTSLTQIIRESRLVADQVDEEARCWRELHKWWRYERARQEAIKSGVEEPSVSVQYEALSITDLVERGFVHLPWEASLGLRLDEALVPLDDDEEDLDEKDAPVPQTQVQKTNGDEDETMTGAEKRESSGSDSFADKLQAVMDHLEQPVDEIRHAKGRRKQSAATRESLALPQAIANVFTRASELLKKGFSEAMASEATVEHVGNLPIPDTHILCPLRNDELFSSCVEQPSSLPPATPAEASALPSHGASLLPHLRSQLVKDGNKSFVAFVTRVPSVNTASLIVNLVEVPSSASSSQAIRSRQVPVELLSAPTNAQAVEEVIDLQWYDEDELFLFCRVSLRDASTTTMLLSLRPSTVFSLAATDGRLSSSDDGTRLLHRWHTLTDAMAKDATQIAFNREKEVAATLDERGQLVYWDLVP